jgi:hypothetical protein
MQFLTDAPEKRPGDCNEHAALFTALQGVLLFLPGLSQTFPPIKMPFTTMPGLYAFRRSISLYLVGEHGPDLCSRHYARLSSRNLQVANFNPPHSTRPYPLIA